MLRLYDYWESGNCYKVRLLLAQTGQPFERVHVDILEGDTHRPEFAAKNANQHVRRQPGHVAIDEPVGTPVPWP